MKTLVACYSYTGNTARLAKNLAKELRAPFIQVKDLKRPSKIKAYTLGCLNAVQMKSWEIEPASISMDDFDRIILLLAVWAWHPAPAANRLIELLPGGKEVEIKMVSASGTGNAKDKIIAAVTARGCKVISYENIAAPKH